MPSGTSQHSIATPPPSPLPHSRLARHQNRRFHARFSDVDPNEHLLNYYSCALVSDILLQGHLYITENYYAFYSNIFGRKTQILLPACDVIKVTKERTARIIPNAVGVYTLQGKYVFGSLLSRNATYRLMHYVWMKSADPELSLQDDTESDNTSLLLPVKFPSNIVEDEESASENSDSSSSNENLVALPEEIVLPPSRRVSRRLSEFPRGSLKPNRRQSASSSSGSVLGQLRNKCHWSCAKECITKLEEAALSISRLPRTTLLLLVSTVLLVVLYFSATVLVYRVSLIHNKMSLEESLYPLSSLRGNNYIEVLRRQQEAVEKEIGKVKSSLKSRVDQLGQVRQSIEELLAMAAEMPNSCSGKTSRQHPLNIDGNREASSPWRRYLPP